MKQQIKQILIIALSIFLTIFFALIVLATYYLTSFSKAAGIKTGGLVGQIFSGISNPYSGEHLTFLILGLDQRPEDNSLLTDTILISTVNTKNGNYSLFSVPRDLWLDDLKTKINALYYYGKKQDPNDGTEMVEDRLEATFDWPIDYTLVLQMEDIEKLIDILGGIEIEVERSFTDKEFPKDDGSNEVMTVSFKKGKQAFNGEKALQFMRSRKSEDLIESSDDARQKRQKKVILAIKNKLLQSRITFLDPKKLGGLYQFLKKEIEIKPGLSIKDLISFYPFALKMINGEQKEIEVPWKPGEENRILFPSKDPIHNTWILRTRDNNWQEIRDFYHQNLP